MKHIHTEMVNRWVCIDNLTTDYGESKAKHLFGYVYIDHTAGITLDIIRFFDIVEDEIVYRKSPVDENIRTIVRFNEFIQSGDIKVLLEEEVAHYNLQLPYDIESIYGREDLATFRAAETFHKYRAVGFPDDIQILLPPFGTLEPELIWARVEKYENNVLTCELLNEPHQDFGVHINSSLTASVQNTEDDYFIVGHISPKETIAQKQITKHKKWWQFW